MHFKWHHKNLSNQSECDSAVYFSLHETQGCHLVFFDFLNTKNAQKYHCFLATHMKHDQSSYFWRGPDDYIGPCPRGPHPGDGAGRANKKKNWVQVSYKPEILPVTETSVLKHCNELYVQIECLRKQRLIYTDGVEIGRSLAREFALVEHHSGANLFQQLVGQFGWTGVTWLQLARRRAYRHLLRIGRKRRETARVQHHVITCATNHSRSQRVEGHKTPLPIRAIIDADVVFRSKLD